MKLTGKQILDILKIRIEDETFKIWDRPNREAFVKYIWMKAAWSEWFCHGYISGAIEVKRLERMAKENLGEFQCLLHHYCLLEEAQSV
jgi:hypothetical protein